MASSASADWGADAPGAPPVPPAPMSPASRAPLRLAIHRVEGALATSMVSPLVRVHLVDAASGYRWGKAAGEPCVFNENKDGTAYLRTKQEYGKEQRFLPPWLADSGQSSFVRPFCTLPKKRGVRELPPWDEAFLLQISPDARMAFLFEILDATVHDEQLRLSPVAWGFLHLAAVQPSRRKLRIQLWSYRQRRNFCGRVALEENSDDIPLVVQEYIAAGVGEERPGALASAMASLLGRRRQKCPAALEFTLDMSQKPIQVEHPMDQGEKIPDTRLEVVAPKITVEQGSPKAETVAEEEILGHLAPQHARPKSQACVLPEELLWQVPSGKRGASRMAISPQSTLLAVATVKSVGSELKIFSLATGRLCATCAGHDAVVHDLCWHSFERREGQASSPMLLISCGGSRVQLYEVAEETPMGSHLKIHAKVNLTDLVYTVRPHPLMSTDPRCLILLCGGHFGLTLCQVTREFKAVAGHEGSLWVAHEPQMQQVQLGHKGGYGREAEVEADVLCVRFSTQTNSLENVYVTDSRGHIMLFQIRYDASVGVSASRVRTYAGSELLGVAIFGLEIVTAQLLEGKRISSVQLSMADDWALLFSRDHVIRLVSLQRGVLKVEQKMLGIHCGNYAVRGTISPDGQYVVCGSESGELLFWDKDGKQLVPPAVPQVRLAGPLMDVVWSERHHFVACCAMDEHALPLLAFVGEDAKDVQRPPKEGTKDPTTAHSPDLQSTLAISGISPSIDSDYRRWADHWINGNENARSAITMEEKKRMKENILLRILDKKAEETHFPLQSPSGRH
ncbi:unnamed protein product [Durusdinium trenchii]|uniref:Uncharacterized protein n=2 Tax=Durusdinium trenchii TaxID=1381693 RepID=A0ABP0MW76_9DINO